MNTLEKIIAHKRIEVTERETLYPVELLKQSNYYKSPTVSLSAYLQRPDKSGIIAEFKKQSPSAGVINKYLSVDKFNRGQRFHLSKKKKIKAREISPGLECTSE